MQAIIGKAGSGKTRMVAEIASKTVGESLVWTSEYPRDYMESMSRDNDYDLSKVDVRKFWQMDYLFSQIVNTLLTQTGNNVERIFLDLPRVYGRDELEVLKALERYMTVSIYVVLQANRNAEIEGVGILDIESLINP